jgi:hypothetical protein
MNCKQQINKFKKDHLKKINTLEKKEAFDKFLLQVKTLNINLDESLSHLEKIRGIK